MTNNVTFDNVTIATTTNLAEALVVCGRYGGKEFKLTGDLVGADTFTNYMNAVNKLYEAFVKLYAAGRDGKVALVERDEAFLVMKNLFTLIGDVNGAPLHCNHSTLEALGMTAGKTTTLWNFEVKEAMKQRNDRRKEYHKAELQAANLREDDPNYATYTTKFTECKNDLEKAEAKVKELQAIPYNGVKVNEVKGRQEFFTAVQVYLYEAIIDRKAKTLEEVLAEEEALRQERKARRQAKRREAKNA